MTAGMPNLSEKFNLDNVSRKQRIINKYKRIAAKPLYSATSTYKKEEKRKTD